MNKTPEQQDQDTLDAFEMATLKGHKKFEYLAQDGLWIETDTVDSCYPHRIVHEIPEGFTRWMEGECPVEPDTEVEIILKHNRERMTRIAKFCFWKQSTTIIGYRIISPTIIPWTFETSPYNAKVKHKTSGDLFAACFRPNHVVLVKDPSWSRIAGYDVLAEEYTQLDGSPCGTEEVKQPCTCASGSLGATQCKIHNKEAK